MILPVIYSGIGVAFFTSLVFVTRRPFSLVNKVIIFFMIFLALPMLLKINSYLAMPGLKGAMEFVRVFPLTFGPFLYLYARIMTDEMSEFSYKFLIHFTPFIFALIIVFLTGSEIEILSRRDHVDLPGKEQLKLQESHFQPSGTKAENAVKDSPERGFYPEERMKNPELSYDFSGHLPPGGMRPFNKEIGRMGIPHHRPPARNSENRSSVKTIMAVVFLSFIFYTITILILLRRHYKKISEYFSYDSIMVNLRWLKWITICFFISYGFVLGASFISPLYILHPLLNPFHTPDVGTTFFIITFSLFVMKQPPIFNAESSNSVTDNKENKFKNERKYEKSGLKEDDADVFLKILENHMRSDKPYLDPDLTIVDLSEKLNIPRHYVTEIINKKLDKNFFMYVNGFRIEEAKQMISDENFSDYSIIRIAYDCGFNSKSTFNNVFKKFTNFTPSDYRQHSKQKEFMQ